MGRWFPGLRAADAEQTRAWRDSLRALWRNPDRTETPVAARLNDRQDDLRRPLGRVQQVWHFQVALTEYDRELARERRAARQTRRSRRTR
jgi:hypothetical protein